MLNKVCSHHLQLRFSPPLFHDFWHFNVKVAAAHHPVFQKEVDELLAKGAIEPSSGGTGFYSSLFVVPKHTGAFYPYSTGSILIVICTYLLLRCQLLNMYSNLSSGVIMPFPLIYRMLIPIVKHPHHFLHFVWSNMPYHWKVLPFEFAAAPRVFTSLTEPILFLCHCKGLCIVIYLDDVLVLIHSKQAGKRACLFLCSLFVHLGLHINFLQV